MRVKKYCMLRLQHMMLIFIPQELLLKLLTQERSLTIHVFQLTNIFHLFSFVSSVSLDEHYIRSSVSKLMIFGLKRKVLFFVCMQ